MVVYLKDTTVQMAWCQTEGVCVCTTVQPTATAVILLYVIASTAPFAAPYGKWIRFPRFVKIKDGKYHRIDPIVHDLSG